ncbi:MAG: penicillin-binding protein 1C [Elusimicrobiaceae bacterium]|nr:penicillin-binding protein 1C [Elusimicrobiaceae bacterium]
MKRVCTFLCVVGLLLPGSLSGQAAAPVVDEKSGSAKNSVSVYDRHHQPLRSFLSGEEMYQLPVPLHEMSPWILSAVVSAEDRRFYTHRGVDPSAVLRAAWQNIRARKVVSGASTITQQRVRMQEKLPKNFWGKIREARGALSLERRLSKEEILQDYLNHVSLGNLTQGMQAAAQYYFGVNAADVSLAQAALLAGLIQAPTRLNPLQNPQGALARRNYVLQTMLKNKIITRDLYDLALSEPLGVQKGRRPFDAPHFMQFLFQQNLPSLVRSTLDKDLQLYAEKALQNHLRALTKNNVTNGAAVVLDNASGDVLAYVGSADFYNEFHQGQVNGVTALRQPGSALKPFVYALALQNGLTAASLLEDKDTFFEGGFRPRNYDESFHGLVSVRKALANSYNVPVIKAAEPLGAARIWQFLQDLDFKSLNKPADYYGLGLALGGGEVTLLELANAYATLARGGILRPVVFAREPQLQTDTPVKRVMPENIAYIITHILADNTARADAFGLNSALHFSFPAAAKTGTSKDYKDNFAIGYTPRITAAVWVGNFDASSMQKVSGISGAAPVLQDILSYAHQKYPGENFAKPYDVFSALICEESGLLAGEKCTHRKEEVFVSGTQPTHFCDGQHASAGKLKISFPVKGDVFTYDPSISAVGQQLHFQSIGAKEPCVWKINGHPVPGDKAEMWFPLKKGRFDVELSCGTERDISYFSVY